MTTIEWLVIGGGLALGYGAVSLLMGGPSRRAGQPPQATGAAKPPAPPPAPEPVPEHWSAVLGVPPSAPMEEVRLAYRRRMSQYHPDKVATLGEELQALALRKTQAIEAAYRQAQAERGAAGPDGGAGA